MTLSVIYWNFVRKEQSNVQVRLQPLSSAVAVTDHASLGPAVWLCCCLEDREFEDRLYADSYHRLCFQN